MTKTKMLVAGALALATVVTGTLATTGSAEAKKGWHKFHKWHGYHFVYRSYGDECFYVRKHRRLVLICPWY
jgi:hypothetical protein